MSVVTKQGDKGKTRLFSGEQVSKSALRLETYGTLDELVSNLGLARSICMDERTRNWIHDIQKTLFKMGAELAVSDVTNAPFAIEPINTSQVTELDVIVKIIEGEIKLPNAFIVPGGCQGSAALDVARTVCRRLERRIVELSETGEYNNSEGVRFVNRLSDVCFLLGRLEEKTCNVPYDKAN